MTTVEKLKAVQTSQELLTAMSLLIAAFHDCDLKSHIRFSYMVAGIKYELTFMPVLNEITHKMQSVKPDTNKP